MPPAGIGADDGSCPEGDDRPPGQFLLEMLRPPLGPAGPAITFPTPKPGPPVAARSRARIEAAIALRGKKVMQTLPELRYVCVFDAKYGPVRACALALPYLQARSEWQEFFHRGWRLVGMAGDVVLRPSTELREWVFFLEPPKEYFDSLGLPFPQGRDLKGVPLDASCSGGKPGDSELHAYGCEALTTAEERRFEKARRRERRTALALQEQIRSALAAPLPCPVPSFGNGVSRERSACAHPPPSRLSPVVAIAICPAYPS